ncbi:ABC transporter permease [Candidatus Cyanaurora vandensis]|uniref:ABC transporter permease n=1 Tax=Candidatus Cyanaurora vandensis TaxID=2714958 RepID=UPI00257EFA23|nr:ABC transporter permease [Candidatus Cyanaurora vandensis]
MNPGRVLAIAENAFKETIRERTLFIVLFFLLLLIAGNYLLPFLAAAEGYRVVLDASLATIHLFSLVIAVFIGTSLIGREIEKRTIFTLIAKPVSRGEFLLGKHLGLAAVLGVLLVLMTVSAFLVYSVNQFASIYAFPLGSIALAVLFSYLELLLLVAAALFFSSFTSPILAALLTFSLYLAGHFSQSLLQLGAISKNEFIQQVTRVIYVILPDLERLNLRNGAAYGLIPPASELWGALGYGLIYTVLLLSAAQAIFNRREL